MINIIFAIFGILTIITGILFLLFYMQIRNDKEMYLNISNKYSLLHWKYIFTRYKIEIILGMTFILLTLGLAMIISVFI